MRSAEEGCLHDEIVKIKQILAQQKPAGVTYDLKHKTTDHTDHKSPGLVLDSQSELQDQKQTKSSSIDNIASKRWQVIHLGTAERADAHGAVDNILERAKAGHSIDCKLVNLRPQELTRMAR